MQAQMSIIMDRNHHRVSNSNAGITKLLVWLGQHQDFALEHSLFCLEHIGMYNFAPLLSLVCFYNNSTSSNPSFFC